MKLCSEDCMPCCDFCKHVVHEFFQNDGKIIRGGPIACALHRDYEHQEIAQACGECDDFYCFRCDD